MYPRRYETLFLLNPELSEEEVGAVQQKCTDLIDQMGGRLLFLNNWGFRRLAYEIKGQSRGFYYLMDYAGDPALMTELERQMRLDERVFRFMTTLREKEFNEEKYEQEKAKREAEEQKAREEAAAAEAARAEREAAETAQAEAKAAEAAQAEAAQAQAESAAAEAAQAPTEETAETAPAAETPSEASPEEAQEEPRSEAD